LLALIPLPPSPTGEGEKVPLPWERDIGRGHEHNILPSSPYPLLPQEKGESPSPLGEGYRERALNLNPRRSQEHDKVIMLAAKYANCKICPLPDLVASYSIPPHFRVDLVLET